MIILKSDFTAHFVPREDNWRNVLSDCVGGQGKLFPSVSTKEITYLNAKDKVENNGKNYLQPSHCNISKKNTNRI